jgi:hypothetical protein
MPRSQQEKRTAELAVQKGEIRQDLPRYKEKVKMLRVTKC